MPKRTSKPKLDAVQNARRVFLEAVAPPPAAPNPDMISQVMAAMGRKGGQIGGKRRLDTMTPAQRSKVAKAAAKARWAKAKEKQ